ncbi:MAG: hypothetical protein IPM46_09355 [Flavobacteriales bacterium]|nr:hypothetical protein [Flavobacteriales bacterium]
MKPLVLLLLILFSGCGMNQYVSKGTHDGVEVAYRWNHPPGKPSELLLSLKNTTGLDKTVSLAIDLYYQGRTVETLEADTCMRAGQTMMGKLNGIYFMPERLTTEQIKDGSAQVEITRTVIVNEPCP